MESLKKRLKNLSLDPGVYICDECIELCNDIIQDDVSQAQSKTTIDSVPKPHEIKTHLDSYVIGQDGQRRLSLLLFIIITSVLQKMNQTQKMM